MSITSLAVSIQITQSGLAIWFLLFSFLSLSVVLFSCILVGIFVLLYLSVYVFCPALEAPRVRLVYDVAESRCLHSGVG